MPNLLPALDPGHLLNDNDWNSLAVSFRKGREITLERILGELALTASTVAIKSKAWNTDVIVQIRVEQHHPYLAWAQNFASVEDARKALRPKRRNQ